MAIHTFLPLVSGVFSFFCGVFVLSKNKKLKLNQSFFLFTIFVAIWLIGTFMMFLSKSDEEAIFWDRFVYLGVVFIPPTFYHFILLFTKKESPKKLLYFGYFLSFVFLVLSRTNYFIEGLYKYNWGVHTQARFFHHLFLVFFAFFIYFSFFNIYRYYYQVSGIERRQTSYLLFVLFIIVLNSVAFLPAYGINISPFFSYSLPIIIVLILSFAIIKYHLFEIRVILTELLVGLIGILLFINVLFSQTTFDYFWKGTILFLFLIFARYLLKAIHEEERRREEAERLVEIERKLRIETERLSRAKDQFILSAQHYFRTPLTSILGYLNLILEGTYGPLPPEIKKRLFYILSSCNELHKRIEEGLTIASFQAGKGILNKKEIQLTDLLQQIYEELKIQAKIKGLKYELTLPPSPLPKIKIDTQRMREALSNLIENAIKHTKEGGVFISLEKKINSLLIKIQDTGIGIPPEELSFIGSQPFERGREAQKLSPMGRGIGLYLSRLIIEAHQGKLWVESEGIGKGAKFYVELPIE